MGVLARLNPLDKAGTTHVGYVGKWILLASLVGLAGGLAAVAVDWLLHYLTEHALHGPAELEGEGVPSLGPRSVLVVLIPALGGLVAGWITTRWAAEASGHGTEAMIRAFHNEGGRVRRRVIGVKGVASACTVGTGGSAGMEGPVAQLGSGIGSAVADTFRLPERDRRIFMLAGASAGIGALFTAPLGGALFAPEVLYRKPEFEGDAIIPCIISSIVGYTTFKTITGKSRVVELGSEALAGLSFDDPRELPVYIVLALLCTLVSFLYVRVFTGTHRVFEKVPLPVPARAAIGGALLGGLALAIGPIAGEQGIFFGGYGLMRGAIAGQIAIGALLLLIAAKIVGTSLTISSGGSGGVFAPSLAIGALLGATVGQVAVEAFPDLGFNPACFALVGMGGFFAGVAKTPIAAILMVCEMTGGYELLAPLMLVSVVHVMLATRWTMYDSQVQGLVDSPAHHGDFVVDVLEQMTVDDVLAHARQPTLISDRATLRQALEIVSQAAGTYFVAVDENQRMVGIFSLSDVRRMHGARNIEDLVIVRDFMVDRGRDGEARRRPELRAPAPERLQHPRGPRRRRRGPAPRDLDAVADLARARVPEAPARAARAQREPGAAGLTVRV